jgi:hypothetical protein
MKILEKEFNANKFNFKQITRVGDAAIYEKTAIGGKAVSIEVIRIKSHNGYELAGVKIAPAEVYPSSSQWGIYGWTYTKMEDAMKKFESIKPKPAVRARTRSQA